MVQALTEEQRGEIRIIIRDELTLVNSDNPNQNFFIKSFCNLLSFIKFCFQAVFWVIILGIIPLGLIFLNYYYLTGWQILGLPFEELLYFLSIDAVTFIFISRQNDFEKRVYTVMLLTWALLFFIGLIIFIAIYPNSGDTTFHIVCGVFTFLMYCLLVANDNLLMKKYDIIL